MVDPPGLSPAGGLRVGMKQQTSRRLTRSDLDLLRGLLGAAPNPEAASSRVSALLVSHFLTTRFPGPGTQIVADENRYSGLAVVGDELTTSGEITLIDAASGIVTLSCRIESKRGEVLLTGTARVRPPATYAPAGRDDDSSLFPKVGHVFPDLLARAKGLAAVPTAVVHPCDRDSLLGPVEAAERGLIVPIFVGPKAKILATAQEAGVDVSRFELVDVPHSHAAAERGAALVREGRASAVMKGSLHTDEFMGALVSSAAGIRTDRRVSHVFVMDVPAYPRPLLITDAAINIAPDLESKRDIVQNAIDLAHVLGIALPKVAILAAVETVTPKMPSTVDAAALCKMADRGQIRGGVLDGPLAFDNAVSEQAARIKEIVSPVAGRADILLAPDLEAGNMIAKQLTYLAGADIAGIVMGLRVPAALTSRADNTQARLVSCALLALVAAAKLESGTVRSAV
jgi:phosphate acetyltransferase